MTSPDSKKFIVMYLIPTAVMDDWKKIDPEKRKAEEEKLMARMERVDKGSRRDDPRHERRREDATRDGERRFRLP